MIDVQNLKLQVPKMKQNNFLRPLVLAISVAAFGLVPTSALANDEIPTCVSELNLKHTGNQIDYKYGPDTPLGKGTLIAPEKVGKPITAWDVSAGQGTDGAHGDKLLTMSALRRVMQKNDTECLDDIVVVAGFRNAPGPSPSSTTGKEYKRVGWAFSHWVNGRKQKIERGEVSKDNNGKILYEDIKYTGKQYLPTISIYTRKASPRSTHIIKDVTVANTICPASILNTIDCLGSWSDQFANPINMWVTRALYNNSMLNGTVSELKGQWVKVKECRGNCEVNMSYTSGTQKGNEVGKETETGQSLSMTVGASVDYGVASGSLEITGEMNSAQRDSIINSFHISEETVTSSNCADGALWAFESTLTKTCDGLLKDNCQRTVMAKSDINLCTTTDDQPPADHNINWQPCDQVSAVQLVDVTNVTPGPGLKYHVPTENVKMCKENHKPVIIVTETNYAPLTALGKDYSAATYKLIEACNNKTACSYKIDVNEIGDPHPGVAKSFVAKYICGAGQEKITQIAAEANGQTINLSCN